MKNLPIDSALNKTNAEIKISPKPQITSLMLNKILI